MGKFLKNSLLFFGALIMLLAGLQLIIMIPRKNIMTFPNDVTIVFLGNSTIETDVCDSLIPNSYNMARSAEPFSIVYAKIKLLKKFNPGIDTVVVGFDDIILYNDNYSSHESPKAQLLDEYTLKDWEKDVKYYCYDNDLPFVCSLYHIYNIKPMLKAIFKKPSGRKSYMGGYSGKAPREFIAYSSERTPYELVDMPQISEYYLNRIIEVCEDDSLTLIFLTTPRNEAGWNDSCHRDIHRLKYNNIRLLDYMQYAIPDSMFADNVHLNYKGAEYFSKELNKQLKNL